MNVFSRLPRLRFVPLAVLTCAVFMLNSNAWSQQEKKAVPGAPRLLPQDTLAYARLDNAQDLRVELAKSSIGRMLNDPALKPFASDVYATMAELFEQFAARAGITLDDLLDIPQGQVALALMPGNLSDRTEEMLSEDGEEDDESEEAIRRRLRRMREQQNSFAGLFMIDAGENVDDLMGLIEKLETQIVTSGYVRRTSSVEGTTLVHLLPPRPGRPEIEYFQRDGTVVFGIGHKTAANALDHWLGRSEDPTLSENNDFTAVMSRCVGAEATRPQLTFYVDPFHIVERAVRRNPNAALVWPLVQELGVGKIRGIGGSSFRGGETFEGIMHLHVLIDPPRDGMFGVLRPGSGDSTPPAWVPADVTSYTSIYWDFQTTYDNLDKIIATFQGAEPLKRMVEDPIQKRFGISFREEVIDNLTGRYVSLRWIEPPARLNSQTQLHAFELKDPVAANDLLSRIRDKQPDKWSVETIGGTTVYLPPRPSAPQTLENFRRPEPCIWILEDYVVFTDSKAFVEMVGRAQRNAMPRLQTVPEYELISSELGGKLDGEKPFMVSFLRGADYVKQVYELVKSDNTRSFVRRAGRDKPVVGKISAMLDRNELPDFEKLKKYFAPSGTFAYDEPSGIHIGSFTLQPLE